MLIHKVLSNSTSNNQAPTKQPTPPGSKRDTLRKLARLLVAMGVVLCITPVAHADSFNYIGVVITGSLTIPGPLPSDTQVVVQPTDFNFTDGQFNWTASNVNGAEWWMFITDSTGAITDWSIGLRRTFEGALEFDLTSSGDGWDITEESPIWGPGPEYRSSKLRGHWAATPEPSALLLMGAGLLLCSMLIRRGV